MPIRGYARDAGMWHMHHRVSAEERGLSMDAMKSQSQVAQDADQAQDLPFLRKKFQPPHMKGRYALVPESHITPQVMDLDAWSICLVRRRLVQERRPYCLSGTTTVPSVRDVWPFG